ncbi:preprotein translocase subunit SecE [Fuchsiella alkaliacetigena]|uniref:preprotein translocase subunit SecE n=1 Tax=Fuchsiella alkaliacetigena TaxID=957042 RepID=UPI00200A2909|nr:preprotein translocase subunit SecE [Fuchsiella alkaliacetigena]MCK8825783.1 preprotein translocase subunit SecE [Fuchsiella alkaliacetigena]
MAENDFLGKVKKFLREVKAELKKVNWPSREMLISYTTVVIVTVLLIAIYMGGVDAIFSRIITPFIFG